MKGNQVLRNIINRIEENYMIFSKTEKLIADYLLQETTKLKNISIHRLSELITVSPSSITRFCKKIGCQSFSNLKMELNQVEHNEKFTRFEASKTIFNKISDYYNHVICRTAESLSEEEINYFIDEIIAAERIIFYGVSSSGLTAKEMAIRLTRMGFHASSESDSHMMMINSTIVNKNTLIIAISNYGETKEIIDAITIAKNNQAKVIAVTSIHKSSIEEVADRTLFVHNTKFINQNQFINSQFSISFLFDIVCLLLLQQDVYHKNMKKTIDIVTKRKRGEG